MATLLIVDDSSTARGIMARLIGQDHTLKQADGGSAALAAIAASDYDLVILDLLMPGMDGVATLGEIRRLKPGLPVLIVSADIQDSTKKRVMDAGASGMLYKPPKRESLLAAIDEVLGKKSA